MPNQQKTHIAKATCKACKEVMTSQHGGHFVECSCGKSFLDQERWDGRYARLGGEAEFIGQMCPENCKVHPETHKSNQHFDYAK